MDPKTESYMYFTNFMGQSNVLIEVFHWSYEIRYLVGRLLITV